MSELNIKQFQDVLPKEIYNQIYINLMYCKNWEYGHSSSNINEDKIRNTINNMLNSKIPLHIIEEHCRETAIFETDGSYILIKEAIPDNVVQFFYTNLIKNTFFTQTVWEYIKIKIGNEYTFDRVYANAQTYGLSGSTHIDNHLEDAYTFLYYVNLHWDPEWEGYTFFFNNEKKVIKSILPEKNTAILFKSNIKHYGSDPSKKCNLLRITLAYKLRKI